MRAQPSFRHGEPAEFHRAVDQARGGVHLGEDAKIVKEPLQVPAAGNGELPGDLLLSVVVGEEDQRTAQRARWALMPRYTCWPIRWKQPSVPQGAIHEPRIVAYPRLPAEIPQVEVHGPSLYVEVYGGVLTAVVLGEDLEDLGFPCGGLWDVILPPPTTARFAALPVCRMCPAGGVLRF